MIACSLPVKPQQWEITLAVTALIDPVFALHRK